MNQRTGKPNFGVMHISKRERIKYHLERYEGQVISSLNEIMWCLVGEIWSRLFETEGTSLSLRSAFRIVTLE